MSAFFVGHPRETDLALFAGGESGPLSRWRIERHLERCPACTAAVTDYFHLAAELQPLAELPELDWDALALGVERRLASEVSEAAAPQRGVPRLAWAAGLAAVAVMSGVMVMRQQPPARTVSLESPATVGADAVVAAPEAPPEIAAPVEVAEARREVAEAQSWPAPEEEPSETIELARAGRMVGDEAAPPPPAPGGGIALMRSAAPPAMEGSARFDSAVFDLAPLHAGADDVRFAADGWVSVRWVSAEGRVTIADVYAP